MSKYKWYKYRKTKRDRPYWNEIGSLMERLQSPERQWRQEYQAEWTGTLEPGDTIRPNERVSEQHFRQTLEAELRGRFDDFIGQPTNGNTLLEIENRVRNTLNEFRHRGLIVEHSIHRDQDNNFDIRLRPGRGVEHINLTIQLDS